jgi:hypothetical protein
MKGVGVVYATFEGLVAISGPGQERLMTENLFSLKEWKLLNPSTIIAAVNDGRYFCFYSPTGGTPQGFYLDLAESNAGKISLGWHTSVRYQDPLSDILWLILDELPTGSVFADYSLVGFDLDPTTAVPVTWKSKRYYVDHPTCFRMARVSAPAFTNTVLTLFSDGAQYASVTVSSEVEFAIPPPPNGTTNLYFEFELQGTDPINRVQIVEDAAEFQ